MKPPVVGILVGGANRRMGCPKALIQVEGLTLLERTVNVARSVTDDVILLGLPPFDIPVTLSSLSVLEDRHFGIGPMGGLDSLLTARPSDSCILLACDMPYLDGRLMRRLVEAEGGFEAVICTTPLAAGNATKWHPCCGLYLPPVRARIQEAIRNKRFGLTRLLDRMCVAPIALVGDEVRWVENWNTPDEVTGSMDLGT